jgi:hypothetical protein
MYNFLTIPDNYKAAKEVSDLISNVNERLVTEFWAEVWQKLEVRLKDLANEKANIYTVKDDRSKQSLVHICKPNWDGVSISCEIHPNDFDLGIYIDTTKINIAAARQLVEQKDKDKLGLQPSSECWPCWINSPSYVEYLNILPKTRETKVSELEEIFFNYVKIASDVCDEIGKQSNIPL